MLTHAKPHSLHVADTVLLRNPSKHPNKFTSRWLHQPGVVEKVKGNSIIINQKNKSVCRNSAHVKPYNISQESIANSSDPYSSDSESDSDDDFIDDLDNTIPYDDDNDEINVSNVGEVAEEDTDNRNNGANIPNVITNMVENDNLTMENINNEVIIEDDSSTSTADVSVELAKPENSITTKVVKHVEDNVNNNHSRKIDKRMIKRPPRFEDYV